MNQRKIAMQNVKLKSVKTHKYNGIERKKGATYSANLSDPEARNSLALGRAELVKSKEYKTRDMKAEK